MPTPDRLPDRLQVEEALARLADIHAQVARGAYFRGYRAVPVAAMGVVAVVVAACESLWLGAAAGGRALDAQGHAALWLGVAVVCAGIAAVDIVRRHGLLPRRETLAALGQLTPALVVGAVTAVVLWPHAELLPGVWTMVFGLGIVASCPYLPRAVLAVALFYVVAGAAMALAAGAGALASPWTMGVTFGVGQLVSAAALADRDGREEAQ